MKFKEVLDEHLCTYRINRIYLLELKHTLMGFFPAIFTDDPDEIIVCTSKELIEKVRDTLPPRESKINEMVALINTEKEIAFDLRHLTDNDFDIAGEKESLSLLSKKRFAELTKDGKKPFRWAPGLLG